MKASNSLWREQKIEGPFPELIREIELRKQNKMDEKLFAETPLRRGAYGQRYDTAALGWERDPDPGISLQRDGQDLCKLNSFVLNLRINLFDERA